MKPIWAIVYPDGRILADSEFEDEDEAWRVALGWPTVGEVKQAKKDGYKAMKVTMTEVKP